MKIRFLQNSSSWLKLAACGMLLSATTGWSQAPQIKWELDDAIRQIERQAKDFDSAMARAEIVTVDADGTESQRTMGTGFIRESDGRMRYNVDGGSLVTLVDQNTVMVYDNSAKSVTEWRLSRHKSRLEPYSRLGFSTTGKDLRDDFLVTILGEEEIGDARTVLLELTPKRDRVRETLSKARLWIDQASWMPKRQEFSSTADGSTTTITYTGMARNLRLNPDLFKENWPRGTEKIKK